MTNLSGDVVLNLAEAAVNKNCGKQATVPTIFLDNLGLPPLFLNFFFTALLLLSGDLSNYQFFVVKNSIFFCLSFYIKTRSILVPARRDRINNPQVFSRIHLFVTRGVSLTNSFLLPGVYYSIFRILFCPNCH